MAFTVLGSRRHCFHSVQLIPIPWVLEEYHAILLPQNTKNQKSHTKVPQYH